MEIMSVPAATAQKICEKFRAMGSVKSKPRTGRPQILPVRDICLLVRNVGGNPSIGWEKLSEMLSKAIAFQFIQPQ